MDNECKLKQVIDNQDRLLATLATLETHQKEINTSLSLLDSKVSRLVADVDQLEDTEERLEEYRDRTFYRPVLKKVRKIRDYASAPSDPETENAKLLVRLFTWLKSLI